MWYMIIALLMWASSFTAGKYAYTMFDPAIAVLFRLLIASAIVFPCFIKSYPSLTPILRKKLWGLSFLLFPMGIFLQFMGLSYTSTSSAVTIVGTEPLLVLLLGFLFFKKSVAWYDWLLGIIAFLGILLLVLGSQHDGSVNLFGMSLVLIAGASFALSMHLGQLMMQNITPHVYTAVILVQGVVLCFPFTLLLTQHWQIHFSWSGLIAVIYLGVCCSWLAYKLWNLGLQSVPTHISAMLIVLEPVFGVFIAMLILGERMSVLTGIGSILVIGSAILSTVIPTLIQRYKR